MFNLNQTMTSDFHLLTVITMILFAGGVMAVGIFSFRLPFKFWLWSKYIEDLSAENPTSIMQVASPQSSGDESHVEISSGRIMVS